MIHVGFRMHGLLIGCGLVASTMLASCGGSNSTTTTTTAQAMVDWAAPAPIMYGTPLSSAQLNATASAVPAPVAAGSALSTAQLDATAPIPGSFVYTPASGTTLAAGNHPASTYVDAIAGNVTKTLAMHLIVGNEAIPSFTPGGSTAAENDGIADGWTIVVQEISVWNGNVVSPNSYQRHRTAAV